MLYMAWYVANSQPPNPPRLWNRSQGIFSIDPPDQPILNVPGTDRYLTIEAQNEIFAMLNKGNVFQYKKNSSNITKNQRYSQIAKMQWVQRTKTWASQSVTSTMPNTHRLMRVNYETIYLDDGTPANLPVTPLPSIQVSSIPIALPSNPNNNYLNRLTQRVRNTDRQVSIPSVFDANPSANAHADTAYTNRCPVYVTPPGPPIPSIGGPYPQLPAKPENPIILPNLPVINPTPAPTPRVVIPDGGQLLCNVPETNVTENVAFDQIPLEPGQRTMRPKVLAPATASAPVYGSLLGPALLSNMFNPTSASGVPGPIRDLFYNSASQPVYYPKQNGVFGGNGNVWPTQLELTAMLQRATISSFSIPASNLVPSQPCDPYLTEALARLYQNVGDDLETLFTYFSIGDLGSLRENLTYDVYQKLATLILNSSYPIDINYTNVVGIIQTSLEGLYKSLLVADAQQTEIARLNILLSQNSSNSDTRALESLSVTAELNTLAVIRPEIKLYIQLYGFPANGIFDAGLINQIKVTLGIS